LHLSSDPDGDRVAPLALPRKRSMSNLPEAPPSSNKLLKVAHHSPVPASSLRPKVVLSVQQQHTVDSCRPTTSIHALAATILYAAFSHIDHWPAPLVKAYADDCFGARSWVDDEACKLLVDNLALVHASSTNGDDSVFTINGAAETLQSDAKNVASAYVGFLSSSVVDIDPDILSEDSDRNRIRRRGSFSSGGSLVGSRRPSLNTAASDVSISKDLESSNHERERNMSVKTTAISGSDSDGSSSGDEDVEEVVLTAKKEGTAARLPSTSNGKADGETFFGSHRLDLYPLSQTRLNLHRVRQRFFGENLRVAHELISSSLSERLDSRSKQNSGLLQCLPAFVSVPYVRERVAENLEKWLQSPALAGLARTLFSSTVSNMMATDTPLESDLRAIDFILAMRLKANQVNSLLLEHVAHQSPLFVHSPCNLRSDILVFSRTQLNAHIDNVTVIAKRMQNATVVHRMYSALLPTTADSSDVVDANSIADKMKMVVAIHRVVQPNDSYVALASTLVSMLSNGRKLSGTTNGREERNVRLKQLRATVKMLATELYPNFDPCLLMKALSSVDVSDSQWSIHDEEDKARLIFHCIVMFVSLSISSKTSTSGINEALHSKVSSARRILLSWCCNDYGPHCAVKPPEKKADDVGSAGVPVYSSILGPPSSGEKAPPWLKAMRCLLFLEDPDSSIVKQFLGMANESESEWVHLLPSLKVCCRFGSDLNDEMLWTVLKACVEPDHGIALSPEVAIVMIENLFSGCTNDRGGSLYVSDYRLVREFYNLARYLPPKGTVKLSTRIESDASKER
jgi:integrator complex subunit 1